MRRNIVLIHRWRRSRPGRIFLSSVHYFLFACAVVLSVFLVDRFGLIQEGINLIWIANAILLAYLLLTPRWKASIYICIAFGSLVVGTALVNDSWRLNLLYNVLDIGEAAGAAWFLRSRSAQLPRFTDPSYLLRFVGIAVIASPAVAAVCFTTIGYAWLHRPPGFSFLHWVAADSLGIAVVTPALVAVFRSHLRQSIGSHLNATLLILLLLIGSIAFSSQGPLSIFLTYPLLTVVALRMGQGWGAISLFCIAAEATWCTLHNRGPFLDPTPPPGLQLHPSVLLQLFIASGVVLIYAISSVTDTLRATDRRLKETACLHELITKNLRDVVILSDFTGHRSFVSASAADWGGWRCDELLVHNSMEIVHPEDRPAAMRIVQDIRAGGEGALLECRVQRKSGEHVWVEANIRPMRDPTTGIAMGVLNMVRDISQRKAAEMQLHEAYRTLESLAVTDSLTRLANRRHFDQNMTNEWRRCLREHAPLSLLLIDVDLFKLYNDTYGHLRGDGCLKQIAEAALDVVTRTGDLVARFGGEEFAVILPNTPSAGALNVGREICETVRNRQLVHSGNPPGYVTVSIGCATLVPALGQHSGALIQLADDALYAAKGTGRNRVCKADEFCPEQSVPQAS